MAKRNPRPRDESDEPQIGYFDPASPISIATGRLPHWRQDGVTYFVTFHLADSLPQEKLRRWQAERERWLRAHPEPHDSATRRAYRSRFTERIEKWLDAGYGSCVLRIPRVRSLVEIALHYFDGVRYDLDEYVVAANHVHVIVTPRECFELSGILHSWKSFTGRKIAQIAGAGLASVPRRSRADWLPQSGRTSRRVWQRESLDHIVRNPESLERFREYILRHPGG